MGLLKKMKNNYMFNDFLEGLADVLSSFGDGDSYKLYELWESSNIESFLSFSLFLHDKYKNIEFNGYVFYELYLLFEIFGARIRTAVQNFSGLSLKENEEFINFCREKEKTKNKSVVLGYNKDFSIESFKSRYEEMEYFTKVNTSAEEKILSYFAEYGTKNRLVDFSREKLLDIRKTRFYELFSLDLEQLAFSYTNYIYNKKTKFFDDSFMRPLVIDELDGMVKTRILEEIIYEKYNELKKKYDYLDTL